MKKFKEWIKNNQHAQFRVVVSNGSGRIEIVSRISDELTFFRLQTFTISVSVQKVAVIRILHFSSNLRDVNLVIIPDKDKPGRITKVVPINFLDIHPNGDSKNEEYYMSMYKFNMLMNY